MTFNNTDICFENYLNILKHMKQIVLKLRYKRKVNQYNI